jgi:hypothetical protein
MSDERVPWTLAELQAMTPVIERRLQQVEAESGFVVKPLPPMTTQECLDHFGRLLDAAIARRLTDQERFVFEELLSVYRMAIRADVMGYKGRFFVLSEDDIREAARRSQEGDTSSETPG